MTTIATDGVTIASDGQLSGRHEIARKNERKIFKRDGRIYAVSGEAYLVMPIIEWHAKGADPRDTPKCDEKSGWHLLVIDRSADGSVRIQVYDNDTPYPLEMHAPHAIGSGREYAIGAMLAGASPKQAVEIACIKDVWSGGDIQVVNIAEALGLSPKVTFALNPLCDRPECQTTLGCQCRKEAAE